MKNYIAYALIALLLSSIVAQTQRPNIILIYADDQGFGDSSYLNPEAKFETPNMDKLAKEGISFTNGHSSDSVCTPSRYGLLTGRYSWRTRLKLRRKMPNEGCQTERRRDGLGSRYR